MSSGSIDSLNLVNTNVTGNDYVGGVCGFNLDYSNISFCSNSGSVSGISAVGGVCGNNSNSSYISYCTNSGSVSGVANVGGVCGYNGFNSNISNCLNSGIVSGTVGVVGGVCGWNYIATISNFYYDKQLCTVGGIGSDSTSNDVEGQAEGKLTTEMTGAIPTGITGFTETNWTFAAGMYPRPDGIENTDAAIVAATPIFLAKTNATTYETVNSVVTTFTYSGADTIAWSSTQSYFTFSNGNVSLNQTGYDTITAMYGNANKSIAVRILKPITVSISGIDTICNGNDVTLTANYDDAIIPTYQWYENGNILTDSILQTLSIAPTTTSVYKVRITETYIDAGHWSEAEKTVTVNYSNTGDTTAVACDRFTWYGTEYTSTPAIAPTYTFYKCGRLRQHSNVAFDDQL